jgi:riboflavin kinase/FMN adenylyltransferase
MKVITDLKEISKPFENAVVTIGNFGGVHIGHQAVIRQAIEKVRSLRGTFSVCAVCENQDPLF